MLGLSQSVEEYFLSSKLICVPDKSTIDVGTDNYFISVSGNLRKSFGNQTFRNMTLFLDFLTFLYRTHVVATICIVLALFNYLISITYMCMAVFS